MTVTAVRKDPDNLTLTITADLDAGVDRAWQLWADPRQLERWWGPPEWPATFVDHDLSPGGRFVVELQVPPLRRLPPGQLAAPFDVSDGHLGFDTFDLVTTLMLEATAFLAAEGHTWPPGVHLLPTRVAGRDARRVLGEA